eukprot:TRINITY_DN13083_c0_g1_i1.p1 TRINITY_DN13083_c0_g1~~TRINITY_DN13083_c0_g1_i1.p1  ORF type:complete len:102 (-),score=13.05 TRINITY_DN13083_c0_g1_i1:92-397(-)
MDMCEESGRASNCLHTPSSQVATTGDSSQYSTRSIESVEDLPDDVIGDGDARSRIARRYKEYCRKHQSDNNMIDFLRAELKTATEPSERSWLQASWDNLMD